MKRETFPNTWKHSEISDPIISTPNDVIPPIAKLVHAALNGWGLGKRECNLSNVYVWVGESWSVVDSVLKWMFKVGLLDKFGNPCVPEKVNGYNIWRSFAERSLIGSSVTFKDDEQ